jgi:hypothetical protein
MHTSFPARRFLVALPLAAALLGGCGSSAEDDARTQVCAARDDIAEHVDELKALTVTTATTDQIGTSLNAIRDDLKQIQDAKGDLSDTRREDLEAANAAFGAAMRDTAAAVGRSISVEGAKADADQAFQQLASSYESSFGQLDCS